MELEEKFKFKGLTTNHSVPVCSWCKSNFGEFGQHWYRPRRDPMSPPNYPDIYYFDSEDNLLLFLLKWS
jgi:hypothetical protein